MSYYDDHENVQEYIKMAEGYDGRQFMEVLTKYLSDGATVLELGMGPGKDLEILRERFQVTGSDKSKVFVERYRKIDPDADLMLLDAVTVETERKFDCVYSNKVLHHLTQDELGESLRAQFRVLDDDGILFHTLWYGDEEEEFFGLRTVYYTEESFGELIGEAYELVEAGRYAEMEENDSFYVVLVQRVG